MEMTPWGSAFLNTLALLKAISNKSGSELLSVTIVDDIVELTLSKGHSNFTMPLHIDKLTEDNVVDVLANISNLAQMEHAGSLISNKTVH